MDYIKRRFKNLVTPRHNTDLQSEILDIIAAPIYLYTISYVVYFGYADLVNYHYGNAGTGDGQPWLWYFQKCLASIIYIQMMLNWFCIRYADTTLETAVKFGNIPEATIVAHTAVPESPVLGTIHNNKGDYNNGHGTAASKRNKSKTTNRDTTSSPAPVQQKKISYWSWKPCYRCNLNAPPRCHHCSLCGYCVLKRDHHCFFAGRCVGFHNQRHFIVFLIWASFGTTYGMIHFIPYLYNVVLLEITPWDCFAPVAVFKFLTGYNDLYHTNLICSFTLNFFFIILSSGFLYEQYKLVAEGVTQFEQTKVDKRKLAIVDPRPISDKIRAVLGQYPGVSVVFPFAHWILPPQDNPFEWPGHKIKHYKVK